LQVSRLKFQSRNNNLPVFAGAVFAPKRKLWTKEADVQERESSADGKKRSFLTVGWCGMLGNFLLFTCNLSVVVPSDFTLSQWDT
jgi:hypothetical protein